MRRQTPYGTPRGDTLSPWPTTKGFVGGDVDASGLIHLGAREYDAGLGRFVSVDPVQELNSPQQWNAYAYANNSPISSADPAGTDPCIHGGGGCHYDGSDPPSTHKQPDKCTSNCGGSGSKRHTRPHTGGCQSANACEHRDQVEDDAGRSVVLHNMDDRSTLLGKACDPQTPPPTSARASSGSSRPGRSHPTARCASCSAVTPMDNAVAAPSVPAGSRVFGLAF
ncbi:RHS repeat-associated core domain-containing protein [Actinoplanes sp. NPDC051475]|uniref:RHS repeat domain-containing protein n=1 Tax=Actinoplanes sp. NPDC051475 TaxID=3157225 RepID=UPI00344C19EC